MKVQAFKRIFGFVLTVAIVVGLFLAWVNRQDIYDWYRLQSYDPPAEIVQLADDTTMTEYARRVFYVSQPLVVDSQEFNAACRPESTIVLGCYISDKGVYIYDVDDSRLAGVKQVTAAHELLHAIYARLSSSEKDNLDEMTARAYSAVDDARLKKTIEEYRKRDASVVPNELHSILATEVRTLPTELEEYYTQFFTDRSAVVSYSERYEAEFENRRSKVDQLDERLSQLKFEIDAAKADLELQYSALTSEKSNLDALLAGGQTAEYNSRVPGFNSQVSTYNRSVKDLDAQINTYNQLVKERNAVAVEVQGLVDSIDSRPQSF